MIALYEAAFSKFSTEGAITEITPCDVGLINTTVFVKTDKAEYVLQRINTEVFKKPDEVMANIAAVTKHLQKKNIPTLSFLKTKDGALFYTDGSGVWRLSKKLAGKTYNDPTPALLERGGEAFGIFQRELSDFDAASLYETIPNFHNTPARIEALWEAVATCERERLAKAVDTVQLAKQFASQGSYIQSLLDRGELPVRVVHNDTKINNVLLDENGCGTVLDLDTVMPGSLLFDFGDAIRSGASTRPEGSVDFEGFAIDRERYEAFLRGFLKGVGGKLTETEKKLLPFSAFTLAYELGVRFLTDYLQNDIYFKTSYPEENLDRARGQLMLARHIFFSLDELSAYTKKYV